MALFFTAAYFAPFILEAVPGCFAVILPLEETEATFELELVHVTFLIMALSGFTVASKEFISIRVSGLHT